MQSADIQNTVTPAIEPAGPSGAPYAVYVAIGAFLVVSVVGLLFLNSKKSLQQVIIPIVTPTQQPAQVNVIPTSADSTASAGSDEIEDLEGEVETLDASDIDDPLQEIDKEIRAL